MFSELLAWLFLRIKIIAVKCLRIFTKGCFKLLLWRKVPSLSCLSINCESLSRALNRN
jgi:hypothetical protein